MEQWNHLAIAFVGKNWWQNVITFHSSIDIDIDIDIDIHPPSPYSKEAFQQ